MGETGGYDGSTESTGSDPEEAVARYEPPAIVERTSVHDPLIGLAAVSPRPPLCCV